MILSGCSNSSESRVENIANGIDVSYETGPQISQGQNLIFWIKNQTDFCVSFPPDYGIKVFSETSNGWEEVPNLVNYVGTEPRLLQPKDNFFSEDSIFARPDLSGLGLVKPANFYVSISGNLCDDKTVLIEKKISFIVVP
jgi:hypothetical protein